MAGPPYTVTGAGEGRRRDHRRARYRRARSLLARLAHFAAGKSRAAGHQPTFLWRPAGAAAAGVGLPVAAGLFSLPPFTGISMCGRRSTGIGRSVLTGVPGAPVCAPRA